MLHLLLKIWFLPIFGMFFAAGADPVGMMGGDGGSDGSAGNADTTAGQGDAADAADSTQGAESADQTVQADSEEADGSTDADPNASVALEDGRQVPAKVKKLFELAKAQGLDKEVKQLWFSNQRLSKAIPGGVNAAIELAKSVEQFGGVEGITDLQSQIETHTADSEMFERGDPRWAQAGFEENPDAALKAFGHSLEYLAENMPEQYDHIGAKIVINTLDASPVHEIYSLLSGMKDNAQAQELAKKLAGFYNGVKNLSSKVPEKKVDAQTKALTDRESKVKEAEMNVRYTQVNTQVGPVMKSSISKGLEGVAKEAGVDLKTIAAEYPGAWEGLVATIHRQIKAAAIKDQRFVDKHFALVQKGDLKRAAEAVNAKHNAIIPDIVRNEAKKSGLFKGKKGPQPTPGAARQDPGASGADQPGWQRVTSMPSRSLVDWSKTTPRMQLDGQYILNDGKKVQVRY